MIPCRGHGHLLPECLRSVLGQRETGEYEVIVVDSAGDDRVAEAVARYPAVRLIRSSEPLFAGPARNLGVQHARGRCLAFIDADCVAEDTWLGAASRALGDERVRIVGGPVGDLERRDWIASADNLLQFSDLPGSRPAGTARYVPACNMAMRKEDFLALDGFPRLHGGEDILLCEAALTRWPLCLRFEPRMRVRHAGRKTWGEYLRHQADFGYCRAVNRLHLSPWHLRWGRYPGMIPAVALKRLTYLLRSGVRYRGFGVWRTVALLPLLGPALWTYAAGFARGCREAAPQEAARLGPMGGS